MSLLDDVVHTLLKGEPLDPKYNDHALKGDYAGHRECHIMPDWLLIYTISNNITPPTPPTGHTTLLI